MENNVDTEGLKIRERDEIIRRLEVKKKALNDILVYYENIGRSHEHCSDVAKKIRKAIQEAK